MRCIRVHEVWTDHKGNLTWPQVPSTIPQRTEVGQSCPVQQEMTAKDQDLGQDTEDRDHLTSETRTALTKASGVILDTIPSMSLMGMAPSMLAGKSFMRLHC